MSGLASTSDSTTSQGPRYATSAVEKQRNQLERLLKDPAKPAHVPAPPKEKSLRPAREMMKNVQGSSAGAGSGEFHVYKASRRREYERIKMMEEEVEQETIRAEFERKRKEVEDAAEAKTAKNRSKRHKKKERAKNRDSGRDRTAEAADTEETGERAAVPFKKRRLVNGENLTFRRPGDENEDEGATEGLQLHSSVKTSEADEVVAPERTAELPTVTIHDD